MPRPDVLVSVSDPVAANDTPEHKALNRRIEIVLQPNLAELPSLEGLLGK